MSVLIIFNLFRFTETSPYAIERLRDLKERIRKFSAKGKCKLEESYRAPDHLANLLLEDLKQAIARDFPIATNPIFSFLSCYLFLIYQRNKRVLEAQDSEHENYAHSRSDVYIFRPEYFEQIDNIISAKEGSYLFVTGEIGAGKSALLANWWCGKLEPKGISLVNGRVFWINNSIIRCSSYFCSFHRRFHARKQFPCSTSQNFCNNQFYTQRE